MEREMLLVEMWKDRLIGITDILEEANIQYHIVRPYSGDILKPEGYKAIIISGGQPSISEIEKYPFLKAVIASTRIAIKENIPILGICLGHQVLAAAIGGKVGKAINPEVGIAKIKHNNTFIFKGLPNPIYVFQYHFDEVLSLPSTTEILASNSSTPIQAFRVNAKPVFGIQFHPEISKAKAKEILSSRRDVLQSKGFDVERLLSECESKYDETLAQKVISNYLDIVNLTNKQKFKSKI
jgi:GMP synthase-like glutamine amidotransferase